MSWATEVPHSQLAQHRTDLLQGGSYYGLGRIGQRDGSAVHLRREEAAVDDGIKV